MGENKRDCEGHRGAGDKSTSRVGRAADDREGKGIPPKFVPPPTGTSWAGGEKPPDCRRYPLAQVTAERYACSYVAETTAWAVARAVGFRQPTVSFCTRSGFLRRRSAWRSASS